MSIVYKTNITRSIEESVHVILESAKLHEQITCQRVVIKPNILSEQLPPKTTNPLVVMAIVKYLRKYLPQIDIVIAEGCYTKTKTTDQLFKLHRYDLIAKLTDSKLVDLNTYNSTKVCNSDAIHLKEFYVSDILFDSYVISVPAMKGHGIVTYTGALKNMFGIAPAYVYHEDGHANKFKLHKDIHNSIVDICRYVKIDFSVVDGSIGLLDHHIKGTPCNPPLKIICAGYDPVSVDSFSIDTLIKNKTANDIRYMNIANNVLGSIGYEVSNV